MQIAASRSPADGLIISSGIARDLWIGRPRYWMLLRSRKLAYDFERQLRDLRCDEEPRPRIYFEEWDEPLITGIGWVSEAIKLSAATKAHFFDRAQKLLGTGKSKVLLFAAQTLRSTLRSFSRVGVGIAQICDK